MVLSLALQRSVLRKGRKWSRTQVIAPENGLRPDGIGGVLDDSPKPYMSRSWMDGPPTAPAIMQMLIDQTHLETDHTL